LERPDFRKIKKQAKLKEGDKEITCKSKNKDQEEGEQEEGPRRRRTR
jgi:hypothetical protein